MAFTLVLVSFSCTCPIVGSILVEAAGGQVLKPIIGMFGFSLAFSIVFTLFAIFPEWMSNLPKSGGWLNSVKVVLGFLELALGLKFLSVADQVYHWGLLDRDIYLALWIVIFSLMGFYLLGKIRLPGDSESKSIGVPRLLLAIVTFSFVIYLIPGMFGAPLKALSGYLPPASSHDFDLVALSRSGQENVTLPETCEAPLYADILPEIPHGLPGYYSYEQALECARNSNKPLFIDFTGHGCVNCREMEAYVWSDPGVLDRLKNDFIMVALYVDDKQTLPEEKWYESEFDGKVKKTIGKQNADFQITRFQNNAQPYYVILDQEENLLAEPMAYNKDVQEFTEFLDQAKKTYEKRMIASKK
jgi:thiol:disulfide interchange protein DsbD